jgi:uncharacterized membrane protein
MNRLGRHLRNTFIAGALAAVPLAATAFVILYVESRTRELFRIDIPFLGIAIAIAAIYLLGLLVTSLIGRYFLRRLDSLLGRLPFLREMYHAWKQVSLAGAELGMFSRVVLITEDTGLQSIGFTSGRPLDDDPQRLCVFLPAAPNPTAGRLCLVRMENCRFLDIPAQEVFKMMLSGGNYLPTGICRPSPAPDPRTETPAIRA